MIECIGEPQELGSKYIHPFFLFYIDSKDNVIEDTDKKYDSTCPIKTSYFNNNYYTSENVKRKDVKISNNYFSLDVYLIYTYNIKSIDDAIEWSNKNMNIVNIYTLDRIWNIVWEVYIKKDIDSIIIDKLVIFYQYYFKNRYKTEINYEKLYKLLKVIIKDYSDDKLTFKSKKAYQYLIKQKLNIL